MRKKIEITGIWAVLVVLLFIMILPFLLGLAFILDVLRKYIYLLIPKEHREEICGDLYEMRTLWRKEGKSKSRITINIFIHVFSVFYMVIINKIGRLTERRESKAIDK